MKRLFSNKIEDRSSGQQDLVHILHVVTRNQDITLSINKHLYKINFGAARPRPKEFFTSKPVINSRFVGKLTYLLVPN